VLSGGIVALFAGALLVGLAARPRRRPAEPASRDQDD
jgi:hypothetical protein